MSTFDFNAIVDSLNEASFKTKRIGVSFAGKSLKLNNENDAKEVMDAIEKCKNMEYLDLEGNTLGPDAAKGISKAIEKNGTDLKRALWKDMFTGRMKDEIPVALEYLGQGLCLAGACLVELDLSDNAFGPIGVKGLASLLSSRSCYTLQELRLNNNGLGISGGKLLADALLLCNTKSQKETMKPLELKVFVAGRNRLENEGAKALATVFQTLQTLEEVVMPQNGIYHKGISALANSLAVNFNLKVLNLNDNTVGLKGAKALAEVLNNFSFLEELNLGDCLLKTSGALVLAEALIKGSHSCLSELDLSFNEIGIHAADPIANAMADKNQLTRLVLNGNYFQEKGKNVLFEILKSYGKLEALCLSNYEDGDEDDVEEVYEDEEDEEDEEEEEEDEDEEEDSEEETDETDSEKDNDQENDISINIKEKSLSTITVEDFIKLPTARNFMSLPDDKVQVFLDYAKSMSKLETEDHINNIMKVIMKVSALCNNSYMNVRDAAEQVTERLYSELFTNAVKYNQIPRLNNALLVNLGLLKGEDKSASKIDWNLEGCFKALEKVCQREFFLPQTKDTLKLFIERPIKMSRTKVVDPFQESKNSLKMAIDRMQST